jgi:hypothetical protein
MTAIPIIVLRCDAPGCTASIATGQRRVWLARVEAHDCAGWTHGTAPRPTRQGPVRIVDHCPEHSADRALVE